MIDLQHLRYFRKVAQLEHMTKASMELCIAQSALSKTIKSMEENLGVPLFDRRNRRMYLNENGKTLLKYADEIEGYLEELSGKLSANRETENTKTSILIKTDSVLLPNMFKQYCLAYPEAELKIIIYNRSVNQQKIKCDFIIDSMLPGSNMDYAPLFNEKMIIAAPSDHPLVGKRISLSQLKGEAFVTMPKNYTFNHIFYQLCEAEKFEPNVVAESSDSYTIMEWVASRMGLAMIPEHSWGYVENKALGAIYLDRPVERNQYVLVWKKNASLSKSSLQFKRFAMQYSKKCD